MNKNTLKGYDLVSGKFLEFGKHRGKDSKWVAYNDPTYVIWAKETAGMRVCSKLLEASRNRAKELGYGV